MNENVRLLILLFSIILQKLFGDNKINPSWEAAKTFRNKLIVENGNKVRLDAEYFDVDYDIVKESVKDKIYDKNPSFILHLGLNENLKNTLNFETTAYHTKEIDKCHFNDVDKCYPDMLETDIKWINNIKNESQKYLTCNGWKCDLSKDPGRYLCNFIYYLSLRYKNINNKNFKVFFLHIPSAINSPLKTQFCINEAIDIIIHQIVKTL